MLVVLDGFNILFWRHFLVSNVLLIFINLATVAFLCFNLNSHFYNASLLLKLLDCELFK